MDQTTVRLILEKVISSQANVNLAEFDEAIQMAPPFSTHWMASSNSARLTFAGEEITFSRMILTVAWSMANIRGQSACDYRHPRSDFFKGPTPVSARPTTAQSTVTKVLVARMQDCLQFNV